MTLTPREKTIIDFLTEKRTGMEIARRLGVQCAPSESLQKLEAEGMIQVERVASNKTLYLATPWQNRPVVCGVRL